VIGSDLIGAGQFFGLFFDNVPYLLLQVEVGLSYYNWLKLNLK